MILLLVLFGIKGNAQHNIKADSALINSSTPSDSRLIFLSDCRKAKDIAEQDIKTNNIKILLQGGIAPVVYTTDQYFESTYRVSYYDYGCSGPDQECMIFYNHSIFHHLNKVYGKKWKSKIRKDAIGLSTFESKSHE
ncbi:hypothetical protein [Pedobacter cryoconitis]|uniref:Uncharacterized protein n=1 Tax=Pedobacter cryoconitis TaxID=188932 RepID=A0A7X0J7N4_9SPHI|nr:hypothetical protein [Pedobacter cryoconitis]MBB6502493.1 hypothetical protein [Pedobacter cryoconitis]